MAAAPDSTDTLVLNILDVGHGDSLVIEFPGREQVAIIDCNYHRGSNRGFGDSDYDRSEPKALTFLKQRYLDRGISPRVAFVCLTHFHYDHYRGMGALLAALCSSGVAVGEFWDPGISRRKADAKAHLLRKHADSDERAALKELIDLYGVAKRLRESGTRYEPITGARLEPRHFCGVRVDIIAPDSGHWDDYSAFLASPSHSAHSLSAPESTDEHLTCSALLLTYGQARLILAGDVTCAGWDALLRNRRRKPLRAHAVKVSHHGSIEGNSLPAGSDCPTELWNRICYRGTTVAGISGGYRGGLPHQDTLNLLARNELQVYCTGDFRRSQAAEANAGDLDDWGDLLDAESDAIVEIDGSYHGNIRIELGADGATKTVPEAVHPPLHGTPLLV